MATQIVQKGGGISEQIRLPEATYPPPPPMFQDTNGQQSQPVHGPTQELRLHELHDLSTLQQQQQQQHQHQHQTQQQQQQQQLLQSRSPRHLHSQLQTATLPIPLGMLQNHVHSVHCALPQATLTPASKGGLQGGHVSLRGLLQHDIPCASLKGSTKHRSSGKMNLHNGNNTISCVYIDKHGVTTATWSKDGERRPSAERLEDSKVNYVKADRQIVDSRQALKQMQQQQQQQHQQHQQQQQQQQQHHNHHHNHHQLHQHHHHHPQQQQLQQQQQSHPTQLQPASSSQQQMSTSHGTHIVIQPQQQQQQQQQQAGQGGANGGAYSTKLPAKQIHGSPLDGPRDLREPHGSPPDLRMAQRTLHELQRFRALQQVVEAQAHLHQQQAQMYMPYVARMVPSQSQMGHPPNVTNHRHSPPVIPVSRRYASSSQPPLNRHPLGGVPAHSSGSRQSPTSSQRQSPPVLARSSPPHCPPTPSQQSQQQQQQHQHCQGPAGSHGLSNNSGAGGQGHSLSSYLYHNSSSPDCLALLFGNATTAAAAQQNNANSSAQLLDHQYPRTSTPHLQLQAHLQYCNTGPLGPSSLCCGPQTSTLVHGQSGPTYTNLSTVPSHRAQFHQALHRVPSARQMGRPKSPSPALRGSNGSDVVSEHPIRRSASYTERQLRKCIGRTTEEIRDLEQQLRDLIISSASIADQPASVEEGLAEILGHRQDLLAEEQRTDGSCPEQDNTMTSNTNNSTATKDNTRYSPPSGSRSRSDTNTPPSRHSSDPERHLRTTSSAVAIDNADRCNVPSTSNCCSATTPSAAALSATPAGGLSAPAAPPTPPGAATAVTAATPAAVTGIATATAGSTSAGSLPGCLGGTSSGLAAAASTSASGAPGTAGGAAGAGMGGISKRTRSRSRAPSASSSSDSGHASRERHVQLRISRSTLTRARSASRLRPASPSSESSSDGSEYFKPRSRTTSDYISRSSSFRSPGGRDPTADGNAAGGATQLGAGLGGGVGTRSLGRSKSDAATFALAPLSRCFKSQPNLIPPVQPFHTLEDTALFFDTLGFLDAGMFNSLVQPSPVTTPPMFFASQSSQDSNNNSNDNPSEVESDDGLRMDHLPLAATAGPAVGIPLPGERLPPAPPPPPALGGRIGLSSHDLVEHAGGMSHETSIVEKNARVIKWLYNCRKSMQQSVVL